MDLSLILSCPCRPGFTYKSPESLTIHKRSKMHKTWEGLQEIRDVRASSKTFENEVERLQRHLAQKEALESVLLKRIQELEDTVEYWKAYFDERFVQ